LLKRNKYYLLIAFAGTLLAVFWQELNLAHLNHFFPESNGLITSADEASYLRPPQNLLEIGEWKDSSTGVASHFMRPPGFGLYFLILKLLFGSYVWLAMKIAQIGFFFFSVLLFTRILGFFKLNERRKLIFTSLYAFMPCYSGFMYFTITESISPFFMLLTTFFWIKSYRGEERFPLGFILSGGFLILIRPQLLVFVLLFIAFYTLKKRRQLALYSLLAFLPFLLWNLRSVSIAGKWMGMHPIYSETNNSLYRPPHAEMTDLYRIWEHQGDRFHASVAALSIDTSSRTLNDVLQNVPAKYRAEVSPIFQRYQQIEFYRRSHFTEKAKIKHALPGEKAFQQDIRSLRSRLISENKADFYLLTPFRSLKKLVVSSHLNLRIHQVDFRGVWWNEALRWTCFLLLFATYLACFIYPVRFFKNKQVNEVLIISLGIVISLFYLAYVQRMNEERYLTPVLPLGLVVLGVWVSKKREVN
jgi:hypothetical protein